MWPFTITWCWLFCDSSWRSRNMTVTEHILKYQPVDLFPPRLCRLASPRLALHSQNNHRSEPAKLSLTLPLHVCVTVFVPGHRINSTIEAENMSVTTRTSSMSGQVHSSLRWSVFRSKVKVYVLQVEHIATDPLSLLFAPELSLKIWHVYFVKIR